MDQGEGCLGANSSLVNLAPCAVASSSLRTQSCMTSADPARSQRPGFVPSSGYGPFLRVGGPALSWWGNVVTALVWRPGRSPANTQHGSLLAVPTSVQVRRVPT